ncbi:MAG: F0F1 ATP synthase subunit A [Planctomycetaceae bacterium]|jgi:F-type H+-transporting ATPase subunit a|nr:F0F1 ATP synthase subunit A [Planctomycetaceae bacterium]
MANDPAAHAQDATAFEFPFGLELPLPSMLGIQITKFMVLELLVAVAMIAVFVSLAKRIEGGKVARGRFWNLWEALLVYVRNDVVFSVMGKKNGAIYLPFIWMIFFLILFCNLFGLLPWMGSPTGSIATTLVLAIVTFLVATISGMRKFGAIGFWLGLVPHIDLPIYLMVILKPMLFVIEVASYMIKFGVLAIRLWANMFGGHVVLAVFVGFIAAAADSAFYVWGSVTIISIAVSLAISLLELLVAFLQAYIFAFLATLFINMTLHQH